MVDVPVTAPITGLIESDVAPETVQLNVEVPFGAMGFGEAEKAVMEGGTKASVVVARAVEETE